MQVFAQIRKVDEEKRLVYGRIAEEAVDKSGELMDYDSSKPHFVKWSQDVAADTDGKSLGNVRAMHGKVAAGKLTAIDFNDSDKAVDVCAKVVDDAEWSKVLEGVYTGFSIGGSYIGKPTIEKMDGRDVKRYTAAPNEVSLVDRPCMPGAKFFQVQKADGAVAEVTFQSQPEAEAEPAAVEKAEQPEVIADGTIQGTPEQVDDLVKMMAAHNLTLAEVIAKIAPAPAPVEKLATPTLRKSLYSCQSFISLIGALQDLKRSAEYEAMYEGDPGDKAIAERIGACIAMCASVVQEMVAHELAEYASGDAELLEMAEKAGALAKLEGDADPVVHLLKVGARNSAADAGRLAKIHELINELGHPCDAMKAEPAGELQKADQAEALQKLLADATAPLQKLLDETTARLAKLEAQPAPARIALRAVAKSDDVVPDPLAKAEQPEVVLDAFGRPNEAASLIKTLLRTGGTPLMKV
jgi:hypothetical protein